MASYYLKSGKTFKVTTKEALDIHERLPVGTYTVGFNACSGQFFLETIDSFSLKGKIYGDTNKTADRILRTFADREGSTGVLLTGEKGSGKTMLAKRLSILAANEEHGNIPTIVVNQPWCGETFNSFIQMIEQPAVIVFDEFEKVYHKTEKQEAMLTLLDGVYPSKKLFILTCNDKWRLNRHLHNRPGRIFYSLDYNGLSQEFISEYCEDNLINKEHIKLVCATAQVFRAFNFDMLKALVEEMNRYGETPAEALKFLNARPGFDDTRTYKIAEYTQKGKKIKMAYESEWSGNPLKDVVQVYPSGRDRVVFSPNDFDHVDERTGAYVFVQAKKNRRLVLKPRKSSFDIDFGRVQDRRKEGPRLPTTDLNGNVVEPTPPTSDDSSESEDESENEEENESENENDEENAEEKNEEENEEKAAEELRKAIELAGF